MEKRVYIAATPQLSAKKKRLFIVLGVLFVGAVVVLQMKLTFGRNAVAKAKNDVSSTTATVTEGVEEAAPARSAIEEFKATLEQAQ